MKIIDPFIVSLAFQAEPTISLIISMMFQIQDFEYISLLMFVCFHLLGGLLVVTGIRQFEDKYEGGILGMSNEMRNEVRIDHLKELQALQIGDLSDSRSRQ